MTVTAYNYQSLTMSCKLQGIAFFWEIASIYLVPAAGLWGLQSLHHLIFKINPTTVVGHWGT